MTESLRESYRIETEACLVKLEVFDFRLQVLKDHSKVIESDYRAQNQLKKQT